MQWNLVERNASGDLRQREHNIIGEWQSRDGQHRDYSPHIPRHLIVQFELSACQRANALWRTIRNSSNLDELLHVFEQVPCPVHKHSIHFHCGRKFVLQFRFEIAKGTFEDITLDFLLDLLVTRRTRFLTAIRRSLASWFRIQWPATNQLQSYWIE